MVLSTYLYFFHKKVVQLSCLGETSGARHIAAKLMVLKLPAMKFPFISRYNVDSIILIALFCITTTPNAIIIVVSYVIDAMVK